ncbi:MAG: HD domain-containing protein [Bacteroidales bacterium]|nr:HD domain-containing protein [Bacteroidales bacterium]
MDVIRQRFPQFDEAGQALIGKAYKIAEAALEGIKRENGRPFLDHPMRTALIATDEIGLPAECAAAVFLHEAMRMGHASTGSATGVLSEIPEDVKLMVEGLNKISTI